MGFLYEDKLKDICVIKDRYNGAYSNAFYLAFGCDFRQIPDAVDDGDIPCSRFWDSDEPNKYLIGKGSTIREALYDLEVKLWERHNFQTKIEFHIKYFSIEPHCRVDCVNCGEFNTSKCSGKRALGLAK